MKNRLYEGARVEIIFDHYGQKDRRISLIGLKGKVRRHASCAGDDNHLAWDVELAAQQPAIHSFLVS